MFRLLLAIACAVVALPAAAAPDRADLRRFVDAQVAAGLPAGARAEVAIGELAPHLRLAPCARSEPFVAPQARLWGRSAVGLRCVQGANWSVQVPVTVRVFGPALVAARALAPGQPLVAADFSLIEVEWPREAHGMASDYAQLDGRVLLRPLAAGQPLALAALRAPQVIAAGDPVRLIGQGRSFAITAQAVALAAAGDGQPVRVRTESGRVLTGTAREGRRVEVLF